MLAILAEANWHPPVPPARRWDRGVQDFNQERVLDRLLVYERRIEHSLYRSMAELRLLRKEGGISRGKGEEESSCQTNPIGPGVSSVKSEYELFWQVTPNGRDAQPPSRKAGLRTGTGRIVPNEPN